MEYSETPGIMKLGFLLFFIAGMLTIVFFVFIEGDPISNAKYELDFDSGESPPPHKIKNIEKGEYEIWYEDWLFEKNGGDPGDITITTESGKEVELESAGGDFDGDYFRIHIVDINKTGGYNISVENPCLLFFVPHDTSNQDLMCQITSGVFIICLILIVIGYVQYKKRKKTEPGSPESDIQKIPDSELKKKILDFIKENPDVHADLFKLVIEATGCSEKHVKRNFGELLINKHIKVKKRKLIILKELKIE